MRAHDATRIIPLRRGPYRSDRHASLDASFLPEPKPRTWPRCSGGCDQGRRLCVTPEACRLPERRSRPRDTGVQFSRRRYVRPRFIAAAVIAVVLGALTWWGMHL